MPEGRWNAVSSPRRLPGLPVLCCPFCRHGQLPSASRPLEPPCAVWLTRLLGCSSPGTCLLKPPQHRPMNSSAASGRRVLAGIQKATHWHPSSIQVNLPGKAWTSPPLASGACLDLSLGGPSSQKPIECHVRNLHSPLLVEKSAPLDPSLLARCSVQALGGGFASLPGSFIVKTCHSNQKKKEEKKEEPVEVIPFSSLAGGEQVPAQSSVPLTGATLVLGAPFFEDRAPH